MFASLSAFSLIDVTDVVCEIFSAAQRDVRYYKYQHYLLSDMLTQVAPSSALRLRRDKNLHRTSSCFM